MNGHYYWVNRLDKTFMEIEFSGKEPVVKDGKAVVGNRTYKVDNVVTFIVWYVTDGPLKEDGYIRLN